MRNRIAIASLVLIGLTVGSAAADPVTFRFPFVYGSLVFDVAAGGSVSFDQPLPSDAELWAPAGHFDLVDGEMVTPYGGLISDGASHFVGDAPFTVTFALDLGSGATHHGTLDGMVSLIDVIAGEASGDAWFVIEQAWFDGESAALLGLPDVSFGGASPIYLDFDDGGQFGSTRQAHTFGYLELDESSIAAPQIAAMRFALAAPAAVPEPAAVGLFLLAGIALIARRHSFSRSRSRW